MLGRLAVLARDHVGVMAGHVDGRPAEAGLLLAFGNHGVERGGLEVPERMEVEVLRQLGGDPDLGERVADGVGMRRDEPSRLGGEDEARWHQFRTAVRGQPLLFGPQPLEELQGAGVDGDDSDAGPSLGGLDLRPTPRRHHGLIDSEGAFLRVDV